MNRKKILLVLLALAIVTSLTAGTLAIYTKSVDLVSNVQAKKFTFDAKGGIENEAKAINLAPQETMNYDFVVTNNDGKTSAEVPLEYTISVDYSSAYDSMPGLQATLLEKVDDKYVAVATTSTADGKFTFANTMAANTKVDHKYQIQVKWTDDGTQNKGQTTAGTAKVSIDAGLNINVYAEQSV